MSNDQIDPASRYQASHEWARPEGTGYACGITAHAAHALGDVVFVELPAVGRKIAKGATFGVIESVKAASDLYMPMSGTVTEVNAALADNPGLVNADCSGQGWLIRFNADNPAEWDQLLDAAAYARLLAEEA
jgi:glycine cleavage system H protein